MNFVGWLNLVPVLLGALIAAPFVLEFERGTFRLAWTQSITADRWLATRSASLWRRPRGGVDLRAADDVVA